MQTIDTEEFKRLREEHVPVIDVLPAKMHDEKHIAGTANVPVTRDDFADAVAEQIGGSQGPVVVYCANAECDASPKAAHKLEKAGFEQVYDYDGGTAAWEAAGGELAGAQA